MLNFGLTSIENVRNNFANIKEEAIGFAKKWGSTPEFEKKRHRKVTSAMAERSFSKLKLIKNYLRCMMSEERLSYLSLISIEQQEARKIELDELITDFAKKNVRRQSLFCDLLLECSAVY
ncbi:hypothetical protein TNCV_4287091 [Trichonephila clavipes]|nr:hypothetical protein TNCV_4287091 [Trichonephila clavipes]